MTAGEILKELRSKGRPENVGGMKRFGISARKAFGVPTPVLKKFARDVRKKAADRHSLAQELWNTGVYDARAVAFLIDDPQLVTRRQMNAWARDFDNWATVDGTCCYLFCLTPLAYEMTAEWAAARPEFVKRAGFSLMAYLAVHDKNAANGKLAAFLPLIERHSDDDRKYVKKAVNWALRQIGKRNAELNKLAIQAAERIRDQRSSSARWIASDALRELRSDKVQSRLREKTS